jgi:hypothetical protein
LLGNASVRTTHRVGGPLAFVIPHDRAGTSRQKRANGEQVAKS